MNKRLAIVGLLALVILVAGLILLVDIRSPLNREFIVKVSGTVGTEFEGFCTHEVKYLRGSRTEVTDIQGIIPADKNTFVFVIPGTEFSGKITSETPGKLITVIYVIDGIEGGSLEGAEFYFSA